MLGLYRFFLFFLNIQTIGVIVITARSLHLFLLFLIHKQNELLSLLLGLYSFFLLLFNIQTKGVIVIVARSLQLFSAFI